VLEGDRDALPRQHFCPCRQRHLFCQLLEAFSLSSVGVVMFVGVADGGVIFELAGKVRVESSVVGGADDFHQQRRTNQVADISPEQQYSRQTNERRKGAYNLPNQIRLNEYWCIRESLCLSLLMGECMDHCSQSGSLLYWTTTRFCHDRMLRDQDI
jgi:hypothetical protein